MFRQVNYTEFISYFNDFRQNKLKGFYFIDGTGDFPELNKRFKPLAELGYFNEFNKKYFNNLIKIRGANAPEVTIFIYNVDVRFKPLELLKFERSNISIIYFNEFETKNVFGEFETPQAKESKKNITDQKRAKGTYKLEPIPLELLENSQV